MLVRSLDIQTMLATLTETTSANWSQIQGPKSGIGIDYFYANGALQAWINLDQNEVTVSIGRNDEEPEVLSDDLDAPEWIAPFVTEERVTLH